MTKTKRIPTQARSREKYFHVLESAKELIGSKGNDSVSMREISKHSGVALTSIYQYFDDKNDILRAIMQGFFDVVRTTIESSLDECETIDDLIESMKSNIDVFYSMLKKDPIFSILWAGLQANPVLAQDDADDSRQNAEIISAKVHRILGEDSSTDAYDASLLLVHLIGATIRLAMTMPDDDGDRLVNQFKDLVTLRLNVIKEQSASKNTV